MFERKALGPALKAARNDSGWAAQESRRVNGI